MLRNPRISGLLAVPACSACNVPGQSVEGRDRYHTDGGTTLDVQDDAPDTGLVEPDLDETAQDTTAADADAAADAGDVGVGDTDADATVAPDTHEGQDTAPDTAEVPDLSCYGEPGSIEGEFCQYYEPAVGTFSVELVDCAGAAHTIADDTDVDGRFVLERVPPGEHGLKFETGSYTAMLEVEVRPGEMTWLSIGYGGCRRWTRLAVLTGAYDHVDAVLDGLGVVYDLYEGDTAPLNPNPTRSGLDLWADAEALAEYETLIINSGDWAPLFAEGIDADPLRAQVDNLREFVLDGGNLFVTDWAWLWVEAAFPEAIEFVGDPGPDAEGQAVPGLTLAPAVGPSGELPVVVQDPRLVEAHGRSTLTMSLPRDAWVVPRAIHPDVDVLIRAPQVATIGTTGVLSDVPMLLAWQPTAVSGTVYFSAAGLAFLDTITAEQIVHRVIFFDDDEAP